MLNIRSTDSYCSSIISLEEKTLTFSNSGQPEILLCRDSKVSFLESLEPRLPLGMRKNLSYQNSFIKLQKNDTLLFFSDAVTESLNTSGKQFGYENIISSVERYSGGSIQEICNGLIRDLNSFIQDAGQYDDMTLVGIKIL